MTQAFLPALLTAPAAAASAAPRTHVPMLDHAVKAQALQRNSATRAMGNLAASAQLFAHGVDPDTLGELLQMQQAAWRRLLTLQEGWLEGWTAWLRYSDQIAGANTMSKLVERECNIGAQLGQLLSGQATDLVALQENIEVDYFYWVNEKLKEKRRAFA